MLVARPLDTGRHSWSSNTVGPANHKLASPRMSNLEPLTTQPDWRDQYTSYLPPGGSSVLSTPYEQSLNPEEPESSVAQQNFTTRPPLEHRHSHAQLGQREVYHPATIDRPDSAPTGDSNHVTLEGLRHEAIVSPGSTTQSLTSAPLLSTNTSTTSPSINIKAELAGINGPESGLAEMKAEDDEDDDDDDMLDAEDNGGVPQTEAERRAERRKLKRFRLTHQQTRFLMSEFAKQAHPDAAHRERLSREIPGLSPRQVQVWFQNRRAKIKRLTADDRDRMMKMRAVPDDFDNVQALHSPYGAVPMVSPVDYASQYGENNGEHMMRPLMLDTMRRPDLDEHISPTGLSPAFNHVGFAPPGSMGTPDVLSPLSLTSSDRYYSSHMSSPVSAGPRSGNPFMRQNSVDNYQMHAQNRHNTRPLQPLQLRETMSRSRSDSLQSPLRSSMSWKDGSLDYGNYSAENTSPTLTGRQQSMYQPEAAGNSNSNTQSYESNGYPAPNAHTGNQNSYTSQAPTHSSTPSVPRFRAASAAYPPGLDLRNQYRTLPSQSSPHGLPSTPRSNSFASPFTSGGFQSAPLVAPADFQLARSSSESQQRDYHMSQLSAPMAPPPDFSAAYSQNMSPSRMAPSQQAKPQAPSHTQNSPPDDFPAHPTESPSALQAQQQAQQQQQQQQTPTQQSSLMKHDGFTRTEEYEVGQKRKRTYSMTGSYNS